MLLQRATLIVGQMVYSGGICSIWGMRKYEQIFIRCLHWQTMRTNAMNEARTKTIQKVAETAADNATLAADIKRKGLMLINRLFDAYAAEATEHRDYKGRNLTDIKRLRDLTGAYKDLTGDLLPGATANNELLQSLLEMEKGNKP